MCSTGASRPTSILKVYRCLPRSWARSSWTWCSACSSAAHEAAAVGAACKSQQKPPLDHLIGQKPKRPTQSGWSLLIGTYRRAARTSDFGFRPFHGFEAQGHQIATGALSQRITVDELPERGAVVALQQVGQLVDQHIILHPDGQARHP